MTKLTPEEERTLQAMMEQESRDQHELERWLAGLTEEERQAYIEQQASLLEKMTSSIPRLDGTEERTPS